MSDAKAPFLSIDQITVRHLDKILFRSLSFQIQNGEQWAVLGKSGSGKSTLLQTVLGRFNITNGKIRYPFFAHYKKEHGITDPLFTSRKLMAFVGQQPEFKSKQNIRDFFYQQRYHAWFAEEAVTVEAYLHSQQKKAALNQMGEIRFSLEWIIAHLLLNPLLQKTLIQLSNGETRRLMIADALLQQPLLLIMDNPFLGLDTASRPILNELLQKITARGTQLLMVTTPHEIPETITHVLLLDQQKVKYAGPKANFKTEPGLPAIAWHPEDRIRAKISDLQPWQDHTFKQALVMEDIRVKYGAQSILNGIDWKVEKGEKWALLGPNGAGKSTLLSLISGDHPQAYANKIRLFDHKRGSGESIWDLKRRIGFVSPEMHQYFKGNNDALTIILSGLDETMGFRVKTTSEKEKQLAAYWLDLLELTELKEKRFTDMSAGAQRLILLIRAMIKNPPLLILDEPCQGLDQVQTSHFIHVVDQLWNNPEKTLLYVSHYKEDIPSCVHHVLQLENGQRLAGGCQ